MQPPGSMYLYWFALRWYHGLSLSQSICLLFLRGYRWLGLQSTQSLRSCSPSIQEICLAAFTCYLLTSFELNALLYFEASPSPWCFWLSTLKSFLSITTLLNDCVQFLIRMGTNQEYVVFLTENRFSFPRRWHARSSQLTSVWRGPRPNPWISKWHYVSAALNQAARGKQTGKLAILQHRLKCVLSQRRAQREYAVFINKWSSWEFVWMSCWINKQLFL